MFFDEATARPMHEGDPLIAFVGKRPLPMHEGDPLIAFVGKRPLPMHESDPLIWDGLPIPRTHADPAIGDFRSQMSSMQVGILLGT